MAKLTSKQELFAQGVASGKTQAEAYREAYPRSQKWKGTSLWRQAHSLARTPKVLARVKELQEALQERTLWSMEEAHRYLKETLDSAHAVGDYTATYKGVELLNKLHGIDSPDKLDITSAGQTITPPVMVQYVSTLPEDD